MSNLIYIHKGRIPLVFAKAKKDFEHYDYLDHESKESLKSCLIDEQGSICAYCMGRINIANSTIEHYIPRNGKNGDPSKSLDYYNLLAVCNNGRNDKSRDKQCDVSREDAKLHINPCSKSDIAQIKYKRNGEIYTNNEVFDTDLSVTLNLNNPTLKNNRNSALKAAMLNLQKKKNGNWDKIFVQKCLDHYLNQTVKTEYVGIIISELEKRLQRCT